MKIEKDKKIDEINHFCLKQMEESTGKQNTFDQGLWLICSSIHKNIMSGEKLEVIKW